jgi:hypothetical protein
LTIVHSIHEDPKRPRVKLFMSAPVGLLGNASLNEEGIVMVTFYTYPVDQSGMSGLFYCLSFTDAG